jgi:hypothetical protein
VTFVLQCVPVLMTLYGTFDVQCVSVLTNLCGTFVFGACLCVIPMSSILCTIFPDISNLWVLLSLLRV